jgi:hypothetical protein
MGYVPYVSFAAHRCVTASTRLCLYKKKKKKKKMVYYFYHYIDTTDTLHVEKVGQ